MYDELIKRLWECVSGECWNCSQHKDSYDGQRTCADNLMKQAADAIEQLSNAGSAYGRGWTLGYDAGREESNPRWIPVTERLPEEYKDVLCYYEYFRYGDYNCMFRTIDRGYYGNGRWGGEAGQGHKNKVLAWMPLPQPPKEE